MAAESDKVTSSDAMGSHEGAAWTDSTDAHEEKGKTGVEEKMNEMEAHDQMGSPHPMGGDDAAGK
jgi:hypothetical protein